MPMVTHELSISLVASRETRAEHSPYRHTQEEPQS